MRVVEGVRQPPRANTSEVGDNRPSTSEQADQQQEQRRGGSVQFQRSSGAGGRVRSTRVRWARHQRSGTGSISLSIGLTAFIGTAQVDIQRRRYRQRHRRIVLAPGSGIGGITIKAGKPAVFHEHRRGDRPAQYSSCLSCSRGSAPLLRICRSRATGCPRGRRAAVRFRTVSDQHEAAYARSSTIWTAVRFGRRFRRPWISERIAVEKRADDQKNPIFIRSELRVIAAQEDERKRISRRLRRHSAGAAERCQIRVQAPCRAC